LLPRREPDNSGSKLPHSRKAFKTHQTGERSRKLCVRAADSPTNIKGNEPGIGPRRSTPVPRAIMTSTAIRYRHSDRTNPSPRHASAPERSQSSRVTERSQSSRVTERSQSSRVTERSQSSRVTERSQSPRENRCTRSHAPRGNAVPDAPRPLPSDLAQCQTTRSVENGIPTRSVGTRKTLRQVRGGDQRAGSRFPSDFPAIFAQIAQSSSRYSHVPW
jgi:hypothetical protein